MTARTLRAGSVSDASASAVLSILFVVILLLVWVTVKPFASLSDPTLGTLAERADPLNQFAYAALGGAVIIYFVLQPWRIRPLLRPVYLATLAWLALSVATSLDPALSARRLVLALFVIVLAAALPLLAANLQRFCDLIAGVILFVLVLCYAGVLLAPQLSIHQASDAVEPLLAGNWRGSFMHKNIAGPTMAIFVFFGLFIAKARSRMLGWTIVAGAGVFLIGSHAKAAIGLFPVVLLLSLAIVRLRSRLLSGVLVFGVLAAINVFTVGSVYWPDIASLNAKILSDPTYTGRTEIWDYVLDHIPEHPWFGHGFGAFWATAAIFSQVTSGTSQVALAAHAHNAFLDLALTIGLPGMGLAMLWTLALPFIDSQRCKVVGADPDLTLLFVRIWLFGMLNCSFESLIFARGDPSWFNMLVAMFGLRYLSTQRLSH